MQALGASVASLAKAQRAAKAGVLLLDAPAGGSDAEKAAAITQLASGLCAQSLSTGRGLVLPSFQQQVPGSPVLISLIKARVCVHVYACLCAHVHHAPCVLRSFFSALSSLEKAWSWYSPLLLVLLAITFCN